MPEFGSTARARVGRQVQIAARFPVCFAAGVMAAFALVAKLWPTLAAPPRYAEPYAGFETWRFGGKTQDYRAFALALALIPICTLLFAIPLARVRDRLGTRAAGRAGTILWLGMLPAAHWLAKVATRPAFYEDPTGAALGLVMALAAVWTLSNCDWIGNAERLWRCGLGLLLALGLGLMMPVAAATAVDRLARVGGVPWAHPWRLSLLTGMVTAVTAYMLLTSPARRRQGQRAMVRLLVALQLPLPLLLLAVIPRPLLVPGGGLVNQYSVWLSALLVTLILGLYVGCVPRAWRCWCGPDHRRPMDALLPPALLALAIFVWLPIDPFPVFSADEWHSAEAIIPWQAMFRFGQRPFIDFAPLFGGYDLVVAGFNQWLFGATVSSLAAASRVPPVLAAAAGFLLAWRLLGPLPALVLCLVALSNTRLLFLLPCLLMVSWAATARHPLAVLGALAVAVVTQFTFNPSAGMAIALVALAVFAWRGRQLINQPAQAGLAAIVCIAAAAVVLLTPLGEISQGYLQFLLENMDGYRETSGVSLATTTELTAIGQAPVASRSGFMLARGDWIAAMFVAPLLVVHPACTRRVHGRPAALALAVLALLVCIPLANWSLCRLDLSMFTRSASVSAWWLTLVLPMLAVWGRRWAVPWLAVASAAAGIYGSPTLLGLDLPQLWSHVAAQKMPEHKIMAQPLQERLPCLGPMGATPQQLVRALELRQLLDRYARRGEPMFDLANRPMMYVYADRPLAARYSSAFYLGNLRMQESVLRELARSRPPVVLLGPAHTLGEGPMTLKNHVLARHLLLNYLPVAGEYWTVLVRPDRLPAADRPSLTQQAELVERAVMVDDFLYRDHNLQLIPLTWGRSWDLMKEHFVQRGNLNPMVMRLGEKVTPPPGVRDVVASDQWQGVTYDLRPWALSGADAGFARIRVTAEVTGTEPLVLSMAWEGRELEGAMVRMAVPVPLHSQGERHLDELLVVPLAFQPRWLLCPQITHLRVRVMNLDAVSTYSVEEISLYQLEKAAGLHRSTAESSRGW